MIIKPAENRERDIQTLQALLELPQLNRQTKSQIIQEIRKIQAGLKGENEARYLIDFHFQGTENWMVIHDLRLEYQGRVAQIDHLLINRFLEIYVCESKRFSEGITINAHGEFTAFYQGKPYGIPSPIAQNERHMQVLNKIFADSDNLLPVRMGVKLKPRLRSLILVASNARISRPQNAKKIEGLDRIIKNDHIKQRIDKDIDTESVFNIFTAMPKLMGVETIKRFAQALARLHRPQEIDWYARFGIEKVPQITTPATNIVEPSTIAENLPPENFQNPSETQGQNDVVSTQTQIEPQLIQPQMQSNNVSQQSEQTKRAYFCADCKREVSFRVAQFCWQHKQRFNQKVYCFNCQKKYPVT